MTPEMEELYRRIDGLEERVEMVETPWWKRLAFYVNGWPRRPVKMHEQRWRLWHRWHGRRDRNY